MEISNPILTETSNSLLEWIIPFLLPLSNQFNMDVYTLIFIVYMILTVITSTWMHSVTENVLLSSSFLVVMIVAGVFAGFVKLSFLLWAFPAIIVLCAGYYFVSRDDEKVEIGESAKSLLDDVLVTVASPLTDEKEIEEKEISSKLGGALKGIRR
jgi:uncharacterized membrane protein